MENQWIVFYDGQCGFCHHSVKFLLKIDHDGLFLFAPLQGKTCRNLIDPNIQEELPDSVVVRSNRGELFIKSDGVIKTLEQLSPLWQMTGFAMSLVPQGLRNSAYDWIASIRHRFFSKPQDLCPLVPEELRHRFLP